MTLNIKLCACGNPRAYGSKCRECKKAESRTPQARDKHLRNRYNITLDQYNQMLSDQNGQCALCGTNEPGGRGTWHIDHNHSCCPKAGRSCGRCIRGLLCQNCNTGLGHFRDNAQALARASLYVQVGAQPSSSQTK